MYLEEVDPNKEREDDFVDLSKNSGVLSCQSGSAKRARISYIFLSQDNTQVFGIDIAGFVGDGLIVHSFRIVVLVAIFVVVVIVVVVSNGLISDARRRWRYPRAGQHFAGSGPDSQARVDVRWSSCSALFLGGGCLAGELAGHGIQDRKRIQARR